MLTRDNILLAKDRPREFVPIEEWVPLFGTFDPAVHGVYVGTMSGKERDQWERLALSRKGKDELKNLDNLRASMASICIQDEDGNRMFSEADIESLSAKSSLALDKIFDVAIRLNKLRKEDQDELVKNS